MVTGYDQYVRVQGQDPRKEGIHFFNDVHFAFEIAIFAIAVCFLDVYEEEVVIRPVLFKHGNLIRHGLSRRHNSHADHLRNAAIHRIHRDRERFDPPDFREFWPGWQAGKASQHKAVGRKFIFQDFVSLTHKFTDQFRCMFSRGAGCSGNVSFFTDCLWVGVRDVAAQPFAPQNEDEPILFLRGQEKFHPRELYLFLQQIAQPLTHLRWNASSPAIGDDAIFIHSAEVAPGCDIIWTQVKIHTQCAQNTASDLVFHWIIAEEPQVGLSAAWSDAVGNRVMQAKRGFFRQRIHIRFVGSFKLSLAFWCEWQAAKPVHDQHHNFALCVFFQKWFDKLEIHSLILRLVFVFIGPISRD